MRFIHKNENGYGGVKVVAELNQYKEAEKREGRGGVAGEGQGLSEEDELRIIDDGEDANSRRSVSSVQLPVVTHRSQSQVQGRVRWDKFLPVGNPKVLLVESDDSTRHVVTALLRNCSYEVTAVSSGIEAWKILEDLNNQIDLVLTEVVTSGLSGIGLLSKIMSHTSCHNTPVIMMSSLDSMGLVVRCLSKGAADFLMKPIRKNELKNLWQHIWRRCHYSSGSGGESFIRNEKSIGAKWAEESNDDTGSDDEEDNRSIGLQARNGSDNGSGTQSSWTKRAAEVDSPQRPSAWDQGTDPPDSTCAQVIYPMPEAYASSWMPGAMQEHDGQDNQLDNVPMGKDLEIGVPRNTDSSLNGPNRKLTLSTAAEKFQTSQLDLNLKNDGQNFDEENLEINNENPKGERNTQAMNLPGEAISNEEHLDGNLVSDAPPVLSETSKNKDKVMNYDEDLPSLELSLKRVGDVADASTNVLDQNILRQSQLSAFTRYNTGSTGNQGQTGNVGSCSPPNNSSEAAKQSNSDPPNQISNSSSNNNNMGSTTNRSFTKPVMTTDKTPAKSTVHGSQQSSVFQPVQSGKTTGGPLNTALLQENEMSDQQLKNQHHHDYHHHHNFHSVQQLQKVPPQDDTSKSTLQCGSSSNASRVPTEANVTNGSLNGSASGSNHGSNGSSAVVNAEGSNKVNDSGITAKDGVDNGSGSGSGSGSGVGVDQNRSAQREAAWNKFRLKRKERCFDKKVRYQSRKKLADERPRVRGQFVRQ
ncbi:two-component response regulator-like PRR73 [Chenopodium quinoa]|uniref:two-component response regulator-like PRR73 n=1 Tax=Chenopodium quinoa TaxID=63459 RepID=UPI000B7972DC|nr:two-component response regulator-like PRR73 [Chenopodium quinoa]XP_021732695.1 two-component response regulator-like PRR73 [Chenopodium quinoa]